MKGMGSLMQSPAYQERTFISFSDEQTLKQNFPSRGFRVPSHKICPITRLPAKYFDPVTELPYANLQVRLATFQEHKRGLKQIKRVSSLSLTWAATIKVRH